MRRLVEKYGILIGLLIPVVMFVFYIWLMITINALKWLALQKEFKDESNS